MTLLFEVSIAWGNCSYCVILKECGICLPTALRDGTDGTSHSSAPPQLILQLLQLSLCMMTLVTTHVQRPCARAISRHLLRDTLADTGVTSLPARVISIQAELFSSWSKWGVDCPTLMRLQRYDYALHLTYNGSKGLGKKLLLAQKAWKLSRSSIVSYLSRVTQSWIVFLVMGGCIM